MNETSLASRPRPFGLPRPVLRLLAHFGIDFPHRARSVSPLSWLLATLVAIVGSLGADALLVAIAVVLVPSTNGYVHFRFSDYGKLTVIGVVVACIGWPIVVRVCSAPRRVFCGMAVLVTVVLLLPDVLILAEGQPPKAVMTLMAMHLAIAVVTYHALVLIARPRRRG